jgi:hypothetical protein
MENDFIKFNENMILSFYFIKLYNLLDNYREMNIEYIDKIKKYKEIFNNPYDNYVLCYKPCTNVTLIANLNEKFEHLTFSYVHIKYYIKLSKYLNKIKNSFKDDSNVIFTSDYIFYKSDDKN